VLTKSEVFKTFWKSTYYHNYHCTYNKATYWCEACWLEHEKNCEDYANAEQERLLEEIKKINPEAYAKIKNENSA